MTEKACSRCKRVLQIAAFNRKASRATGYASACRDCTMARNKELRPNWARLELDAAGKQRKKLRDKYGLTLEQYGQMLSSQNGVCAICLGVERTGKRLAVDHCHRTGTVRGLLCFACNTALGKFSDSADLLRRAASYLEEAA